MDAWETLIANSALQTGDAWEHLNNQQGGSGLTLVDLYEIEVEDGMIEVELADETIEVEVSDDSVDVEVSEDTIDVEVIE